MRKILKGFDQIPGTGPSVCMLLDYLSDIVPALELMLKLLSGNRGTHEVGEMYEAVFNQPHADADFMTCLKQALRDQKYLLEPSPNKPGQPGKKSIAEYIPEMEMLFDELQCKIVDRYPTARVAKRVILPNSFGEYLRRNLSRFYNGEHSQTIDLYLQNPNGVEFIEVAGFCTDVLR